MSARAVVVGFGSAVVALVGCFSDQVRIDVTVARACGPCCVDFTVLVDGLEEAQLAPGQTTGVIERTYTEQGVITVIPAASCGLCPSTEPEQVVLSKWGGDDVHATYFCDGRGLVTNVGTPPSMPPIGGFKQDGGF